ncbi:MAG: YhcH/YjgK/YiaL family protein [Candidatus Wallbacteria bacterium]|nr:YhcH/YjgK/YiaL family protein [Candidatus Wallbacteria bacterium]
MIWDLWKNHRLYLPGIPAIAQIGEFLRKTDLEKYAKKETELDNRDLFVLLNDYRTQVNPEVSLEAHRNYLDLQLMISGEEIIRISHLERCMPIQEYTPEKDAAYYASKNCTELILRTGEFAVFYPWDAHQPCLAVSEPLQVKKLVFKIAS